MRIAAQAIYTDTYLAPPYAYPYVPPMIGGQQVSMFLEATGWKQTRLAKAVGIKQPTVSRWITKGSVPDEPTQRKLERLFERYGQEHLLPKGGGGRRIPLLAHVSAGALSEREAVVDEDILDRIEVGDLPPGRWVLLRVEGNSMNKIAPEGSLICVNMQERQLVDQACYVIADEAGDTTFKRYNARPEAFMPVSFEDLPLLPPAPGMRVFGRVRRVITYLD